MGKYLVKAINRILPELLDTAVNLAIEDVCTARNDAKQEAVQILKDLEEEGSKE